MKNFKTTPAFVRYFKARFQPFTKPLFLGSFGGLLIAGLAIYQYWKHPEWLQTSDQTTIGQEVDSSNGIVSPSPEDLSVAADIDNSDLLLKELEQNQASNELNPNQNKDRVKIEKKDTEYSRFQESQKNKLKNSTSNSNSGLDSSGIKTENQKITELLQPPSFSSYQSTENLPVPPIKKFEGSKVKLIPNPIGNVYLSNRKNKKRTIYSQPSNTKSVPQNTANVAPTNSSENGLNSPTNSTQETNGIDNSFVPASSVIQSQTTVPSPVIRSNVPAATKSFNVTNPYLGSGFNSTNGLSSTSQNNIVNGNNPSSNLPNNPYNNTNSVGRTNYSESVTNGNNNSSSLQNNYRSPQLTTPNYNRSVPSGYQLQPQGYTQNKNNFVPRNNGLSRTPTVSNVNVGNNSNSQNQQTNSASGINNYTTPSLQPSGVLTTGEIRR